MTWNIEGWKRNCHNLQYFVQESKPDLIFLSEPQSFQCDISLQFECFYGSYSFHLNSDDVMCPDLPLDSRRSAGGTMIMWRSKLDPYIKVLPTTSSSVLPIILSVPGMTVSAHICLYLPTSGKEAEFVSALASLEVCIQEIQEDYGCPIYLRGDCNVNQNNHSRASIYKHFSSKHNLFSLDLAHPTHHHFVGNGKFDTQLDVILSMGPQPQAETLHTIICKLSNPLVQSNHDVIVTVLPIPLAEFDEPEENLVVAPKVQNNRVKILWEEENIDQYQALISTNLLSIRKRWANAASPSSISILLTQTNDIFVSAAKASNKYVVLGKTVLHRPKENPDIRAAQKTALTATRNVRLLASSSNADLEKLEAARTAAALAKSNLRQITRALHVKQVGDRDNKLFTILGEKPSRSL